MIRRYLLIFTCCFPFLMASCQTNQNAGHKRFVKKEQKHDFYDFINTNQLFIEKKSNGIAVSIEDLPCDCHVQGIGWAAENKQIVITCQDKCAEKDGAYILLFDEGKLLPLDIQKGTATAFFNHPSAIQIANGIFPVAFASLRNQDSFIKFYEIKDNQLQLKKEGEIHIKGRHIGALAYATIQEETYLLGVGWDAEDLTIWKANGKNAAAAFEEHFYTADTKAMIKKRSRRKWGPYNSLWLGNLSDGRVVLVGTHGKASKRKSSLDIWEIIDIAGNTPQLKLISSKKVKGKTHSGKHLFHEGVTIKTRGDNLDTVSLIAAPHDFTTANCPSGYRCSSKIYEVKTY